MDNFVFQTKETLPLRAEDGGKGSLTTGVRHAALSLKKCVVDCEDCKTFD